MEKVLATIAQIIDRFTQQFPGSRIFIVGSTPARTRLYQLHIGKFWGRIGQAFTIWGYREGGWEKFGKGINYEAFTGERNE